MFGFFVAGASLLGLVYLSRHRRHHGQHGFTPLRGAFRRLDASPAQEKAIREAVQDTREALREFRQETQDSKAEVASALREESFDEARINQWVAGRKAAFDELTPRVLASLRSIHETLDAEQRSKVAQLIERGGFRHHRAHAHRARFHSC